MTKKSWVDRVSKPKKKPPGGGGGEPPKRGRALPIEQKIKDIKSKGKKPPSGPIMR